MEKIIAFIFQSPGWALVALVLFTGASVQSLEDHVQHQGRTYFRKDRWSKWRVNCLILWTGCGIRLLLSSDSLLMLVQATTGAGTVREVTTAIVS